MLTLVHIADLHLGAEYSFLPEEKAAVCREAQFQLLERVIDHSGDISAEVILIPGAGCVAGICATGEGALPGADFPGQP